MLLAFLVWMLLIGRARHPGLPEFDSLTVEFLDLGALKSNAFFGHR